MRSALELAGLSGAEKRSHSPGRRTMPPGPSSHMTPTTVSIPPASRGRQRARTARARGIRPTTVSSTPVRIHLRIRLLRVNGGAPYLPTEPADWLHTTRFRRCDRCLIAAPCHPRLRSVSSMVRFCALQERAAQSGWRPLFGPDICPVGTDRARVMRCRRSLLVAVGRCCCCHRCCHPRQVRAWPPSPPVRGPCVPPLPPIGLTAAALFAGGEVSRVALRVR
jgi:hypothetical protein